MSKDIENFDSIYKDLSDKVNKYGLSTKTFGISLPETDNKLGEFKKKIINNKKYIVIVYIFLILFVYYFKPPVILCEENNEENNEEIIYKPSIYKFSILFFIIPIILLCIPFLYNRIKKKPKLNFSTPNSQLSLFM